MQAILLKMKILKTVAFIITLCDIFLIFAQCLLCKLCKAHFFSGLIDGLIDQHMEHFDTKQARDMIDLYVNEHHQKSYSFEVSKSFDFLTKPSVSVKYQLE